MNTLSEPIDRRGPLRTYLQSVAFLVPAVACAAFVALFVFPKVELMWATVGLGGTPQWPMVLTARVFHYGPYALLAMAAAMLLLEFGAPRLAHYRGVLAGTFVFAANCAVLAALTMLCVAATLAAPFFAR